MGSGWHEWPLMIFTVFGQCVAGGFIVLALALLRLTPASRSPAACYRLQVRFMGADGHWLYRPACSIWLHQCALLTRYG